MRRCARPSAVRPAPAARPPLRGTAGAVPRGVTGATGRPRRGRCGRPRCDRRDGPVGDAAIPGLPCSRLSGRRRRSSPVPPLSRGEPLPRWEAVRLRPGRPTGPRGLPDGSPSAGKRRPRLASAAVRPGSRCVPGGRWPRRVAHGESRPRAASRPFPSRPPRRLADRVAAAGRPRGHRAGRGRTFRMVAATGQMPVRRAAVAWMAIDRRAPPGCGRPPWPEFWFAVSGEPPAGRRSVPTVAGTDRCPAGLDGPMRHPRGAAGLGRGGACGPAPSSDRAWRTVP
jgi:hypothetical protein